MDIAGEIIEPLSKREPVASICPSGVARALAEGEMVWRALMPALREAATALARLERIIITQGDQTIAPTDAYRGPVRLRRGPAFK